MSVTVPVNRSLTSKNKYTGRLARTLLLILLGLSMLPVLIIGGFSYYRARILLSNQTTYQLQTLAISSSTSVNDLLQKNTNSPNQIIDNPDFQSSVDTLLRTYPNNPGFSEAKSQISKILQNVRLTIGSTGQFFLVIPDGTVVTSTDTKWEGIKLSDNPGLYNLVGTNITSAVANPTPLTQNQLGIFITRTYESVTLQTDITLFYVIETSRFTNILASANQGYPSANAYFYTSDNQIISINSTNSIVALTPSPDQQTKISSQLSNSNKNGIVEYISRDNTQEFAYIQWMPELKMGIVLEVPTAIVYQELSRYLGSLIALFLVAIIVIGGFTWFSAQRTVQPILQLAKSTQIFAQGDWNQRSLVKRNDEIGLLADSFNRMADELSSIYRALETRGEERTQQLRAAAEVAQFATSAQTIEDLFKRTVDLIIERFNYYYISIFLIDETGQYAVQKEGSGNAGRKLKAENYRLPVGSQSIVGWVSANKQSKVVSDVENDPQYMKIEDLSETRSEAGIPILFGNEILGVLDVQSTEKNAFDAENIIVLQTLANQISSAIRNVNLLQSAETDLQEIIVLLRSSHQIAIAQTQEDVILAATNSIRQTHYLGALLLVDNNQLNVSEIIDHRTLSNQNLPNWVTIPLGSVLPHFPKQSPTVIPDINRADPKYSVLTFIPKKLGAASAVFIPIVRSNLELSGYMMLATSEKVKIEYSTVQAFQLVSQITGFALERLHLLQQNKLEILNLGIIEKINQNITPHDDTQALYGVIHNQVKKVVGDVDFYIALFNSKNSQIEIPYLYQGSEIITMPPFSLGEGLVSLVIKNQKPILLVQDTAQQAQVMGARLVGKQAKSWLGIPLLVNQKIIGAMVVQDIEHDNQFNQKDLVVLDSLGQKIAVIIRNGLMLDHLKLQMQEITKEKLLLDSLLTNIPDSIFFKDLNGRYTRASQSMTDVFGLKHTDEIIGKSDFDFINEMQATRLFKEDQSVIESGRPAIGLIERSRNINGMDSWSLTSKIPLTDSQGQVIGLMGISRDISELKFAQEVAQRRAQQLQTIAEITRDSSGTLELHKLLERAVNLIRDRFGFYHASIFLMDPIGEYAVLQESTGEAGKALKEAGHKLAVGSKSIVGQAILTEEPIVVNNVSDDPLHFPNPLLPNTKAEMVIPLRVGSRVLGALDVQSPQENIFSADDVSILQLLSDQIAIAVVNSELFAKAQENITQHRLLHQITTAAASSSSVDEVLKNAIQGLRVTRNNDRMTLFMVSPEENVLEVKAFAGYEVEEIQNLRIPIGEGILGQVAQNHEPIKIDNTLANIRYIPLNKEVHSELAVPLVYREELLGLLNLENDEVGAYDENDLEIMSTLASSLAAIISNARLIEQIRYQVDRQQMLFEIANKIRRAVDIRTVMEVSTNELARGLGAHRVQIEIFAGQDKNPDEGLSENSNGNSNGHHNGHDPEVLS